MGYLQRHRGAGVDEVRSAQVYTCGPWCQGPARLQALSVLDPDALKEMGHNSTAICTR